MVVLGTKISVTGNARDRATDSLRSMLENDLGSLDVVVEVGIRHDDFPTVTVTGPDAVAARNLLRERWGEITDRFEIGEEYVGTLERWNDHGIELAAGIPIEIPRNELGLGPGSPQQIVDRFGLIKHLPMRFIWDDPPRLSDGERDRLFDWRRGQGRVNVNNATRAEVRATVNRTGHADDIITVERLGLLEQSVICRESTDPPGLLSEIGRYLPSEMRCVIPQ